MALDGHSGAETNDFSEWSSIAGSPAVVGTHPNTGSYEMQCDSTGGAAVTEVRTGASHKRISFFMYIATAPSGITIIAGGTLTNIRLGADRKLYLFKTGTQRDVGGTVLDTGKYYRISASCDGDNAKIYLDDIEECSAVDSDFDSIIGDIGIGTAVTADLYFDDYACDNTSSLDDLGDIRTLAARPDAEGTDHDKYDDDPQGWADTSESSDAVFGELDNDPPTTASYDISYGDAGDHRYSVHLQSMADLGIDGDTIVAVNFMWYYKTDAGGANDYGIRVYDNTGAWTDDTIDDPKDPTWLSEYAADTPAGSDPWTEAIFAVTEMGMATVSSAGKELWWYEAYAMIAYTPAVGAYEVDVNDNIGVTDAVSVEIPVLEVSVYDSIGVTDVVDVSIVGLALSVNVYDSIDVTDAVTVLIPFWEISVYDSIDVAEDVTVVVDWGVYVSDSIGVTDTVSISIPVLEVSVYDSIGVTDASPVEIQVYEVSVYDSIDVAEDIALALIHSVDVNDNIDVTDAVSVEIPVLEVSIYDSIGVIDTSPVEIQAYEVSVYDSIDVAEDVSILIPYLPVAVYDSIDVAEDVSALIPFLGPISVYDSIDVSEDVTAMIPVYEISVFDSLDVSETVSVEFPVLEASVFDSIEVTDYVAISTIYNLSVYDSIDVSDLAAVELGVLMIAVYDTIGGILSTEQSNTLSGQLDVIRNRLRRIAVTNTHNITVDETSDYTKLNTKLKEVDARIRRIGITN